MNIDSLLEEKVAINERLYDALVTKLSEVSQDYLKVFGEKEGLNKLGEDLCTKIAPTISDMHWSNLVLHLKRISG